MSGMPHASRTRQLGISLIEFMIAAGISLVLIATIGNAYVGAKHSFRTLDALARIQEGARYAFEFMGNEVRMAGFTGGPSGSAANVNVVNTPLEGSWDPNLKHLFNNETDPTGAPLFGREDSAEDFSADLDNDGDATDDTCAGDADDAAGCYLRGDILNVVHADRENAYTVSSYAGTDFTLSFGTCPGSGLPEAGEIFVAADYTHAAVFQIKSVTPCTAGMVIVSHDTGTVTPGNAGTSLGAFPAPITLYPLRGVTFYVGKNSSGEPALFRRALGHAGTIAQATAEELVEGVENMQITYGVDTDATADGAVDAYWTADQVSAGEGGLPGATPQEWWGRVLSVRVSLLMVSRSDENVTGGAQTYTFDDITTTPSDGLLRKVTTTTLAVRNRL